MYNSRYQLVYLRLFQTVQFDVPKFLDYDNVHVRVRFIMDLANLLDPQYIATLDDTKIVDIFLHGDNELNYDTNKQLFSMAQAFLIDSIAIRQLYALASTIQQ